MSGLRRVQSGGGFVRTYGEPPKLTRGGETVARGGHVTQAAPGFVIGGAGEGSACVGTSYPPSAASSELPKFFPEIEPTYQASLSSTAARRIRREVKAVRHMETGGWLFLAPGSADQIIWATGPGEDGLHGRSSFQLGEEPLEAVKEIAPHLQLGGCYHSHPGGDLTPSVTDRRAWGRAARMAGGYWVSLIAGPARDTWSEPEIHGWITVQNGNRPFTEPLRIVER